MAMIFDHDRTIEKDIQEVMDFVNPFYQTFYDSNNELNCRTMFRNKTVILKTTNNYSRYLFKVNHENTYYESYFVDFKTKNISYSSGFEGSVIDRFNPHSRWLNFPQYYGGKYGHDDLIKGYCYYGNFLRDKPFVEYFKEFGVDPENMTEAEFFTFALNFNLMENMK